MSGYLRGQIEAEGVKSVVPGWGPHKSKKLVSIWVVPLFVETTIWSLRGTLPEPVFKYRLGGPPTL